jgi:hypothetical protein
VFPLEVSASEPGEFQLVFSSKGGGAAPVSVTVSAPSVLSRDDAMQIGAYLLFVLCAPLFVFLVPHSRALTTICTLLVVFSSAILVYFFGMGDKILSSVVHAQMHRYAFVFVVFVLFLIGAVLFGFLSLALGKVLAAGPLRLSVDAEDERGARRRYLYVKWLINERQAAGACDTNDVTVHAFSYEGAPDCSFVPLNVVSALAVATLFVVVSILLLLYVHETLVRGLQSMLLYFPSLADVSDASVSRSPDALFKEMMETTAVGVLLGGLDSGNSSLFEARRRCFQENLNRVVAQRERSSSHSSSLGRINSVVAAVLLQLLEFLSAEFPNLPGIPSMISTVKQFRLFESLDAVNRFLSSIIASLDLSFIVSIVVCTILVVVAGAFVASSSKRVAEELRRGTYVFTEGVEPPSALSVASYIPLHAFHFFLLHQLSFWLLLVVVILLSWTAVRQVLYDLLLQVVLPVVLTGVVVEIVQAFLVKWYFLVDRGEDDELTVARPEVFSFWMLYGIVSNSISAIGGTFGRIGLAMIAVIASFVRLDFSIFPKPFMFLDDAHSSFVSAIALEVQSSNPVMLYFVAVLLTGLRARQYNQQHNNGWVVDHTCAGHSDPSDSNLLSIPMLLRGTPRRGSTWFSRFFSLHSTISGALVNMCACYAESVSDAGEEPAGFRVAKYFLKSGAHAQWARRNRIVNKFWLALLLYRNPSLRQLRKRVFHAGSVLCSHHETSERFLLCS